LSCSSSGCSHSAKPHVALIERTACVRWQLRHPNVLEYKDSLEIEAGEKSGGGPVLYIVTEPVAPLNWKLDDLNLQGADRCDTPP